MGGLKDIDVEGIRLKQRDRFSIEIKTRYRIKRSSGIRNSYAVKFHFFFPTVFGISPSLYERQLFLRQLRMYLRFDTPRFTVQELLDPDSDWSPLARLERNVFGEDRSSEGLDKRQFIYESKLLGCVYKSLLRDYTQYLRDHPAEGTESSIKELHQIPKRFRRIRDEVVARTTDETLIHHTDMIDEHLSLLIGRYFILLLNEKIGPDGDSTLDQRIVKTIRREISYRRSRGYPSVPKPNQSDAELEEYVYREKMLKKYVTEALFFEVQRTDTLKRTEHMTYALAAGIAMVVATSIAFFGQHRYGSLTTTLFVVLVVGYMLKDRLKDFFRDALFKTMGARFTVRKTVIRDGRKRRRIAHLRERVGYRLEKKLDDELRQTRNRGYFEKILFAEDNEHILSYEKHISLSARTIANLHTRVDAVADINVINLRPFLQNLGAQYGIVPVDAAHKTIKPRVVKRVYHMNLIVEYDHLDEKILNRYRLVVDGRGIKRIESVGENTAVEPGTWSLAYKIGALDDDDR